MLNKHLKKTLIITMCLFIIILVNGLSPAEANNKPKAIHGLLELTDWNWKRDGIVSLDGQWEFYWQELLTPADFEKKGLKAEKNLITVPRAWNSHVINGKEIPGDGYATYRLIINLPDNQILGVKIPRVFTSYNLWIDGQLIASNGKVAKNKDQMIPQYLPTVKYFKPVDNKIELVMQVANFRHRSGGVLESLLLGPEAQISEQYTSNLSLELFLFGSLFIIGFYHMGLFIFRTKDKSTLYFGIYSILIGLRTLLVGEIYFIHLFPNFSWELAHKLQTLAYYLGVPLVFMFLKSMFPNDLSKRMVRFIQIFGLSFGVLVLLTPAKIFTQFNPIYQIFTLALFPYALYIIFSICYKKREGSYLIGIGVAILILFTLNDIIFLSIVLADSSNHFFRNFITRGNLSSWGLLIFVFAQSLVLAQKFSKSFTNVELMTEELQQLNESLEDKVKKRTQALETSKKELEEAYQAVSRSEKSRQDLIQNISHDLRTPLTSIKGYVNAILDGIVDDPDQQKTYLKRVSDRISNLNHMVQDLMDLSQLQSRNLKLNLNSISVKSLFKNLAEKYSLDMMNAKVSFKINYPPCWRNNTSDKDFYVVVDIEKLDRVCTNLLSNALKNTTDGDHIELSFDFSADNDNLLIKISDTGIGVPPEDLPYIFDRFYMVSKARQNSAESSGLGLAIVKEIIEYHGGQVWVESELGKGSCFYFSLPIQDKNEA